MKENENAYCQRIVKNEGAHNKSTKMYFVSIADLCAAARTPVAFLKFTHVLGRILSYKRTARPHGGF